MLKKKLFVIISTILAGTVALGLVAAILYTSSDPVYIPTLVSEQNMAHSIKLKYEDAGKYVYGEPLYDLPPDHVFSYDIKFDPAQKGIELNQIASVFLDANLTNSVDPQITYNAEISKILVSPPKEPVLLGKFDLWDKDTDHWGYAQQFYAAQFYSNDGKKLDKPLVTVFTVQNDLKAPNVEFYKENGCLGLKWNPISGAEKYLIYKVHTKNGKPAMWWLGETSGTDFLYEETLQLKLFNMAYVWLRIEEDTPYFICVQAIGGNHASPISNPVYSEDITPILPYMATTVDVDDTELSWVVDNIGDVGIYKIIEMLDGSRIQMPVSYDIENAEVLDISTIIDGIDEEIFMLYIPFDVVDTLLNGCVVVKNYDKKTLASDLSKLKEREKEVLQRGGRLETEIDLYGGNREISQTSFSITGEGFNISATNAFSEYLALNMLNGVNEIDIRSFNERFDIDSFRGAILEAVYQNPLILGISSFSTGKYRTTLFLEYNQSRKDQQRKQKELQNETARIIDKIIKPEMSDLEKELAINDYLCATVKYDIDAFNNAKKYNFKKTDVAFNDSFTAYGALINKSSVCSGYSAAFKLLADEADLPCIVVTGYLYGNIPHAWNKVLIDGDWMTVDTTSNDNETLFNVLFNVPDNIAQTILVEDGKYISSDTTEYKGNNQNLEYYRIQSKYYSRIAIADMLLNGLEKDGSVVLRTDYELSDRQFYAIFADVMNKGGYGANDIEGKHWLGAIYLNLKNN